MSAAALWPLLAAEERADERTDERTDERVSAHDPPHDPPHGGEHEAHAAPRGPIGRIAAGISQGDPASAAILAEAERVRASGSGAGGRGPGGAGDPGAPWRVLAAAWALAERSGAALAGLLLDLSEALQAGVELGQLRDTALAGPKASARLVLTLPLIGLGFGAALGSRPLGVLVGSPLGWALLLSGGVLLAVAALWSNRLVRAVDARRRLPGIELDLLRIALGGGAAPEEAGRRVADALDRFRVGWADLREVLDEDGSVARVLRTARAAGVPVREMLAAEARAARAEYRSRLAHEIERLGVRLMLPLGLCVLPAFLAVGVLPVLIGLLSDGLGGEPAPGRGVP
ncbi:hypothetical protein [Leucobacter sp. M11]|uniref:hypothetical protein n=1 Tax=Leucobacter sp. M11 TaxID=2993565 RepID=UPI002D7EAE2D|nr:hypothetical protein [Leucobacter sp. M11]MEB4614573.1 hypothetical protein [Leucobacter sp. M11]